MTRSFVLGALFLVACGGSTTSSPVATAPLLPPSGSIGDECAVASDCGSGLCDRTVPGGYCSRPCATDDECGGGAICDGGACLQRCTVQRECRSAEFECFDLGRPDAVGACAFDVVTHAPTVPNIGAPCRAAIECLGPENLDVYCIPEVGLRGEATGHRDGFCTALGCVEDHDCGDGAICVGGDGARYCAPRCSANEQCREGYTCDAATGGCLAAP
jgi:hypothetical protein